MRVMFAKSDDGRRCSWRAELPGHRRVRGSTMAARSAGTDLPHDLAQFVVETGLGLEHGFWNLVANGATFQSTGRRPTKIGPDLDAMLARWRALRPGDELVVVWPTRRLPRPAPRVRRIPARRRVGR
jgi:hypothetical protein